MERSTLDAHFFNIRDLNRFGAPHIFEDVQTGPKNRLHIANIPVAADGSYAKKFGHRNNIEGAFYGEGHAETAGTFEKKLSIIGAFGAKKVKVKVKVKN
ncbi:MAG: transferrin-binding protein-like solute binding protein [Rhodospirillales bacterium]|nr:transferrin-binding protein-like solute binding protein [Rhodospirillales bacterium]